MRIMRQSGERRDIYGHKSKEYRDSGLLIYTSRINALRTERNDFGSGREKDIAEANDDKNQNEIWSVKQKVGIEMRAKREGPSSLCVIYPSDTVTNSIAVIGEERSR